MTELLDIIVSCNPLIDGERWRIISSHPDYAISCAGRVKRVKPDRLGRISDKPLTPVLGNHGYLIVTLHRDAQQSTQLVHRLVCAAFCGPPPSPRHQAAHSDGDRTNNTTSNLAWLTPGENNEQKRGHGTMLIGDAHPARIDGSYLPRGSRHANSKLTDDDVIAIRADQRAHTRIAKSFGVSQSLVSQIKSYRIWRHVP